MIIGVLELASKYKYGLTSRGAPLYLFKPYDPAIPDHVVGCSHRDTTANQIAIIETSHQETGQKIRGLLHRLIGPVGDLTAEKEALLLFYNPAVISKRRIDLIPEAETRYDAERQELSAATGWLTFHVDPPGCRDVDDALAYHPTTGKWAITIADVAAAVPESCEVDASAAIKGTSFYDLEGRVLTPMLPAAISEGSASLLPGSRKRGLTLFLDDEKGSGSILLPTWITVDTTYTYGSVLLSPIAAEMQLAFGSGSGSSDPHKWIESAMILYNAFVAAALAKAGSGLLRVQPPSPELTAAASHPSLAHLLQEAATYETADVEFKAHTSLGLPVYCHATSPLRRYADLVNQRVLHSIRTGAAAHLSNQKTVAAHLNERTKAARRFGRDLTFLTHVTPGRVHEVAVIIMLDDKAYVPLWNRVIRIRHFMSPADNVPGKEIRIHVYCDPTQRNWKQRVLTAPVTTRI